MPELRRLRELVDAGMGPPAIWRSGKLPDRSESAIRNQLTKRGWWGSLRPRFDGERCAIQIPMTVMLRGRLRQRAQAAGVSMAEVVRRYCEKGLRG